MSIELRLSHVEPPDPDPYKTIYRDIRDLAATLWLSLTVRYYNFTGGNLYFRITGSGTGYTFGTVDLGLLAGGSNAYENLDHFASRAKPAAATTETITLTLRAYTDAGYTNLYATYERSVEVVIIDHGDGSWNLDVDNDFDDGTVQGWDRTVENGVETSWGVANDYLLSAPWSLRFRIQAGGTARCRGYFRKSITTPNLDEIYAVIDIRPDMLVPPNPRFKNLHVFYDSMDLVFLGEPFDITANHYMIEERWIRIVVPLPKNTTIELKIRIDTYNEGTGTASWSVNLDDFKVISK